MPEITPEAQAYFDSFLVEGEPAEGPERPKDNVAGRRFEITLAHEFTHLLLPHYIQQKAPMPGVAPTLLGRADKLEHIAEVGASLYAGGEDAQRVTEEQREAFAALWRGYHGLTEEDRANHYDYHLPAGPQYVTCRELDVTQGRLPFRLKNPGKKVGAYVVYQFEKPSAQDALSLAA